MKYVALTALLFCSTAFAAGSGKKDADMPNLTDSNGRRGVCTIVIRRENSTFVIPASSIKYLMIQNKKSTELTFILHGYTYNEISIAYPTSTQALMEMERYNRLLQECPVAIL